MQVRESCGHGCGESKGPDVGLGRFVCVRSLRSCSAPWLPFSNSDLSASTSSGGLARAPDQVLGSPVRHRSPVLTQSCPRRGQSVLDAVENASRCTPSKADIVRAKAVPKSSANSLIHEVWPVAGKQRGLGRSVRVKLTA